MLEMQETQQFINRLLPVGKIFKKALRFPFCQTPPFWMWMLSLCLVWFAISQAKTYLILPLLRDLPVKGMIGVSTVLGGLESGLVFTLLAIPCHRMILLRKKYKRWTDFCRWSHQETRFFMWSFVIYLGAMCVLFHSIFIGLPDFLKEGIATVKYYLMFMDYSLLDWLIPKTWIPTMWSFIFGIGVPLIKFLLYLYTASRVSLLLPVISIDAKSTLFSVWNLSQKNGWRLVFLATIPVIPYYLGGSILNGVTMIFPFYWILGIVGSAWFVFWMILEVAILSEVYKELSVRRQVPSLATHFELS